MTARTVKDSGALDNVEKRYLVHTAAINLGLVMRRLLGHGTPRGLQGLAAMLR